jgi:TRAP-type C4-dicarboxylate transport system substrate-binding protein
MERGVIDGYVWSDFGKYPGWEKVTKYVVDAPFLNMDMVILVNQKKYNKLSNDLKDVLSKYTMQFERDAAAWYAEGVVKERKKYEDAGCTYIKLSSKEEKHIAEAAEKAAWEKDVRPIVSQKEYDEARAILIK